MKTDKYKSLYFTNPRPPVLVVLDEVVRFLSVCRNVQPHYLRQTELGCLVHACVIQY